MREELNQRREHLIRTISADYLERMDAGLGHWVDGGQAGRLCWGLMRFRKPIP